MKREPISISDPQITAYALGELSVAEKSEFERQLADSPEVRAELAEIQETINWINSGFAKEVPEGTGRESILEMGDPRMTAYALGEIEGEDLSEIEALVAVSDDAKAELAGIEATIDCLKDAFAAEASQTRLMGDPVAEEEPKIVAFDLKRVGTRVMWGGLAAVFAGLVTVGSIISGKHQENNDGGGIAFAPPASIEEVEDTDTKVTVPAIPATDDRVFLASHGTQSNQGGNSNELYFPKLNLASELEEDAFLTSQDQGLFNFDSLEYDPFKSNQLDLPGFKELSSGKPVKGHYKLRNEEAESLSDAEYGHGNLQFTIRKGKKADGTPIETIKLIDTRIDPDGTRSVSEKEYIREGEKVGKPISNELVPSINEGNPQALRLTGFTLKDAENPTIADEISTIMDELSIVRDELDTEPAGAERKALQSKFLDLIKRQQELAEQVIQ